MPLMYHMPSTKGIFRIILILKNLDIMAFIRTETNLPINEYALMYTKTFHERYCLSVYLSNCYRLRAQIALHRFY